MPPFPGVAVEPQVGVTSMREHLKTMQYLARFCASRSVCCCDSLAASSAPANPMRRCLAGFKHVVWLRVLLSVFAEVFAGRFVLGDWRRPVFCCWFFPLKVVASCFLSVDLSLAYFSRCTVVDGWYLELVIVLIASVGGKIQR